MCYILTDCLILGHIVHLIFVYSNNCLIDLADPYDQAEYQEHLSKLPGERHDLDAQCKLIHGKDSKLCEVGF